MAMAKHAGLLTKAAPIVQQRFAFSLFSSSISSLPSPNKRLSQRFLRPSFPLVSLYDLHGSSVFSRGFTSQATTSSLRDLSPNWSNRPPKETIVLDGCDFEHWLVVLEQPEGNPTRDEIIDTYIKTLAQVLGSEEEARKSIYSVSTRCYYAFGCIVSEELSYKIKNLPRVRWVLPDSYLDVKNKLYGGEPFIDGQAVPYDPKYHEEWMRNHQKASERSRRKDGPRTRNFDRRRENMQNRDFQSSGVTPMPNNEGTQNKETPPMPNTQDYQNRDMPQMTNSQGYQNRDMPPMPNSQGFQNRDIPRMPRDIHPNSQGLQNRDIPLMQGNQNRGMALNPNPQGYQNREVPSMTNTQGYQNRDMPPAVPLPNMQGNQNRDMISNSNPQGYQNREVPSMTKTQGYQNRDMTAASPVPNMQGYQNREMSSIPNPQGYQNREIPSMLGNQGYQNKDMPPTPSTHGFQSRENPPFPNGNF
ncbi:hypothetical protein AMTRI_Chr08g166880 [Amborella trichopoda]